MAELNVKTWDKVYSEGRSLLEYPDETIVSFLSKKKYRKGLDIGCGAGRHTFLMNSYGIEAYGIDSSEAAITYSKKKANELGLKDIYFENKLAQDIQFAEESFDLIIVWGLFHYLNENDREELLHKVYHLLIPGGTLLCTLRSKEDTRFEQGKKIGENQYLVNYFDAEKNAPLQTVMYFWDEQEVRKFLSSFRDIQLGHRTIEPIGKLGIKTSHWLIAAMK